MSYDVAKVGESLTHDNLARAKVVSEVQFLALIVITIFKALTVCIAVVDFCLATNDQVKTIGVFWYSCSSFAVLVHFFVNLLESQQLLLAYKGVTFPSAFIFFSDLGRFLLFLQFLEFLFAEELRADDCGPFAFVGQHHISGSVGIVTA